MSELEMQLEEMLNIEGVRYFYHYTTKNGEQLLEEGIYLDEPNLHLISIELNDEEKENVMDMLCAEYRRAKKNKEKGYVVCPEDLMASIDLDSGELVVNDRSVVLGDYYNFPIR